MADELTGRYSDLLTSAYDCVDRIVLNAYFSMSHSPGGPVLGGGACTTVPTSSWTTPICCAWQAGSPGACGDGPRQGIPVIHCERGQRKHLIAEDYLATHSVGSGCSSSWSPAPRRRCGRSNPGHRQHREEDRVRQPLLVAHHGPRLGRCDDEESGRPPFGAQVIRGGHEHEYVTCVAGRRVRLRQGGQLLHRCVRSRPPGLRSQTPCPSLRQ